MNSIVALLFLGVVAIASGSAVRNVGWGSAPPPPAIDLELSAELAAVGAGQAAASQDVAEAVSGDGWVPAQLASGNGIIAIVEQTGDITEVASANTVEGSTSTINVVDVTNDAAAADYLNAALLGANSAQVANAAATDASGQGALAADAQTINLVNSKKN